MSYILDAMRKSERDRALGQVANLPPASNDWRGHIFYAAVVLLMIALVAAGIWFAMSSPPPEPSPSVVDSGPLLRDEPLAVEDLPPEDLLVPDALDSSIDKPATDTQPPVQSEAISPSSRVTVAEPDDWRDLPDTAAVAHRLPESLVQLKIGIHVYDPRVSKRMVLINGRRYQQGSALPAGADIVEITPEGMVLNYRATRFHKHR